MPRPDKFDGADRVLISITCGSQSVGNAYCGLGSQDNNNHDEVSVLMPFQGDIIGVACKGGTTQANDVTLEDGVKCIVYQDKANDKSGAATIATCTTGDGSAGTVPGAGSGKCFAEFDEDEVSIAQLDSLSIFVDTTNSVNTLSFFSGSIDYASTVPDP